MGERRIDRRRLLLGGSLAGTGMAAAAATWRDGQLGATPHGYQGVMAWEEGMADAPPGAEPGPFRFFTTAELAFVRPAIDRLIPPDGTGPSATEADVHVFIDRQLAGLYGRGDHYYLGGPWPKGLPEQGYQSRLTPAQVYRIAIPAIDRAMQAQSGKAFGGLAAGQQDAALKALEAGRLALPGVDGKAFFALLLQNTLEGYFSDPIYGGNKGMAAWRMIGFPGARYDYRDWALRHGERVPFPPLGLKGRPAWSEA